ncbi:FAD-binding oxidoreductase [Nocardia sp. NPDC051911]|uniref:FAD-binding oxidoreductase n=1 Tax=Nocardia sp. NPDC051911 TaxID=3154648 RepID=UPI00342A9298
MTVTTSRPFEGERELPRGNLETALDEFRAALGENGLLLTPEAYAEYRDPYQPTAWSDFTSAAILQPTTVEQVQEIVRIAQRHQVTIWTQSQGRNNGYGGAAPRVSGCVTLNLRRMNKVLEINEKLGYALVEPGVSFQELYDAIEAQGANLMLSVPDLGWGSVVGNALDSGTTYLPNGKDFRAVCGLEVVTPDGDLLRTGMGAMEGNKSWNLYPRSFGPALDQLFVQSNLGIVTKMGVWLTPKPEKIIHAAVTVPQDQDLIPLIDTLRELRLDGTIDGVPCVFNTLFLASGAGQRDSFWQGEQPVPEERIEEIAKELGVGRWFLRFALWGDDAIVDLQMAKAERAFAAAIPGARIVSSKRTPEEARNLPNSSDRVLSGVPNLEWLDMRGWYGGENGGHMGFSPVVPLSGQEVYDLECFMRGVMESNGLDYFSDIIVVTARAAIAVSGALYDYTDEEATRVAYDATRELVGKAGARGFGEYRAHLHFMDKAAAQYGFNDHAYLRFVERLKDAVDPAGILSPGKQGVWPRSMRAGGHDRAEVSS